MPDTDIQSQTFNTCLLTNRHNFRISTHTSIHAYVHTWIHFYIYAHRHSNMSTCITAYLLACNQAVHMHSYIHAYIRGDPCMHDTDIRRTHIHTCLLQTYIISNFNISRISLFPDFWNLHKYTYVLHHSPLLIANIYGQISTGPRDLFFIRVLVLLFWVWLQGLTSIKSKRTKEKVDFVLNYLCTTSIA